MNRLERIYQKQRTLMEKFDQIESMNDCLECPGPVSLDDFRGQMKLRRYAWQVTEEIGEALWGRFVARHFAKGNGFNQEVADAFHFLIELAIISGIDWQTLLYGYETPDQFSMDPLDRLFLREGEIVNLNEWTEESAWFEVILGLTAAMNLLKNRPWKKTRKLTDVTVYVSSMHGVFRQFIRACIVSRITADQLFESYFAKAEINEQRIAS